MTQPTTVFFEPLDVLQFRDHRPADAGYQNSARSVLPGPSVFYGCLRTALFRLLGADFFSKDMFFGLKDKQWQKILGSSDELGTLTMRGPLLARWREGRLERCYPMPRDLVSPKEKKPEDCKRPPPIALNPWNGPKAGGSKRLHWNGKEFEESLGAIPWTTQELGKPDGEAYLTEEGLEVWRQSDAWGLGNDEKSIVRAGELYRHENRLGIVMNRESGAAEPHRLYTQAPFRFSSGAGFGVDLCVSDDDSLLIGALEKLDGQIVPLGGKAHRTRIRLIKEPLMQDEQADKNQRPKACLLTALSPNGLEAIWGSLACVVTGRAQPIGGYDMAKRAPRPLETVLPAGTVLYFEDWETLEELPRALGQGTGKARMGYGTMVVGNWKPFEASEKR